MKQIFIDYGSAIGPFLAFVLGIAALYVNYKVDYYQKKKNYKLEFNKLVEFIRITFPPKKFHPNKSKNGLMHADQARNFTNIARFYSKLLILEPFFNHITVDIYKYGSIDEIQTFNSLKWWYKILLRDVEVLREKKDICSQDISDLNCHFNEMLLIVDDKDYLKDYIN